MNGLVEHLERQLESNRRLLQIVLAQGEAIKVQDVQTVLARLADVQQEMVKRAQIERERDGLLQRRLKFCACLPIRSAWTCF